MWLSIATICRYCQLHNFRVWTVYIWSLCFTIQCWYVLTIFSAQPVHIREYELDILLDMTLYSTHIQPQRYVDSWPGINLLSEKQYLRCTTVQLCVLKTKVFWNICFKEFCTWIEHLIGTLDRSFVKRLKKTRFIAAFLEYRRHLA